MGTRDAKPAGFSGTERFVVRRRIGEGGMGIVYEVDDLERGTPVALKTLRRLDAQGLYRFKREFRALQDLQHPNLVRLGELFEKGGEWFFTMELVDGDDFHTYVRTQPIVEPQDSHTTTAERPGKRADVEPTVEFALPAAPIETSAGFDEQRLRTAIVGIARGLAALHAAGKVHRDVKPTNVLIEPSGRVVVLDFGLISEPTGGESMLSVENAIVGTPAYMSPEQGLGKQVTAASDCYSLGVILYEALTGRLPFNGSSVEILSAKQTERPTPPSRLTTNLPADLEEVCTELLATAPEDRPATVEVLARLAPRSEPPVEARRRERHRDLPFCGRRDEFKLLRDVYRQLEAGGVSAVLVRGVAGIGKTRLVAEYLQGLRMTTRRLVVLDGRCYEREDIAFKAIDSLVDRLSRYWAALPADAAAALLPREASFLPRIFPVLERVPVVADAPPNTSAGTAEEIRQRAFAAFREVLQRLGDRGRLVLVIDNMQWVDPDTVTLLSEVLRQPEAPNLLLLLISRTSHTGVADHDGDHDDRGLTQLMLNLRDNGVRVSTLEVGPLARNEAKRLAERLLDELDPTMIARLATESGGSPFFLVELARYMESTQSAGTSGPLSLEAMVARRVDALAEHAQLVLGLVVMAGEPIRQQVVAAAADLSPRQLSEAVAQLRDGYFIRAAGGRATDHLEPYHDRIRLIVASGINQRRAKKYHHNLAQALETFDGAPERLARHYLAAGENELASLYAVRAGDRALAQFDFNRAARLYQLALEVGEFETDERCVLMARCAGSLAAAGFCVDAAALYAQAASIATPERRLEYQRRRAEQLLIGGHIRLGQEAIGEVLEHINMTLPRTNRRALVRLFRTAAQLKLRGLGWKPVSEAGCTREQLTRVDTCWSATTGLIMSSFILGPVFSKTGLLLALKLGEPLRIARHAACEAVLVGMTGRRQQAERLIALSAEASAAHGSEYARFYTHLGRALLQYNAYFELGAAIDGIETASDTWASLGRDRGWEADMCALFGSLARMFRADYPELRQRARAVIRTAERTGNRFLQSSLRTGLSVLHLANDDATTALRELNDTMEAWLPGAGDGFDQPRFFAWFNRLHCALYAGELDLAGDFDADYQQWSRSFWVHAPIARTDGRFAAARHAVQAAADIWKREPSAARERLGFARNQLKLLRKDQFAFAETCAALVEGAIARVEGDDDNALDSFQRAARVAGAGELTMHAATAELCAGELLGGDEGAANVAAATAIMREREVIAPERFRYIFAPGTR